MSIWKDFHPSAETVNSWYALSIIGTLALIFAFFTVPPTNKELITFALGAIAGALTMGNRKTDKATSSGDIQGDTIVQAEPKAEE